MSHIVKTLVGGLSLPDGNTYFSSNTIVTLTDAQYGRLSPTIFSSGRLQDMGFATNPGMALKGFEPFPRQSATGDAKVIRGDTALVMGLCQTPATVTTLRAGTRGTAATAPTLVRMGIYSLSGSSATGSTATLVARTASNTANFIGTWAGYSAALDTTGGYPSQFTFVSGQTYALALLVVGGTTDPIYYGVVGWLGGSAALEPILTNNFSAQTDLATSYTIGTNASADMPWIGAA